MLMRLCLIVAIIAGLAIGTGNFVLVKDKIVKLAADRDSEKSQKENALMRLAGTNAVLKATLAELTTTKATLETTTAERDKFAAEAESQTKRADRVTGERDQARKERDDAQAELAAYHQTELKPEQIIAINKQFKSLQNENALLARIALDRLHRIQALTNELAIYKTPEYVVPLPAGLKGKVLANDPKWHFIIVDVGQNQGALENGDLLVNRNGRLVAKARIRNVQKERCIANVLPGWQLGEIFEGDQVIPANPEIVEGGQTVAAQPGT